MKAVKVTKVHCAFCGEKVVKRESFAFRMGTKIRKLRVTNGYLVITSYSNQLPICKNCWQKVIDLLSNSQRR